MKSEALPYALFSLREMEHRYTRARDLMVQHELDALLVSGEENFQYFTGTTASIALHHSVTRPSVFILPLEGEPIVVTQTADNIAMGSYVEDVRTYRDLFVFPIELVRQAIEDIDRTYGRVGAELGLEQRMGMPVGEYLKLVEAPDNRAFVDAADVLVALRMIKSSEELAYMKQAADITARARQRLFDSISKGMTERDVARAMRQLIAEEGGDRTSFVILQGGQPGSGNPFHYDRELVPGSVLAVDAGAYVGTHTIDYVRMATLGEATDLQRKVHGASIEVSRLMTEALRPGLSCSGLFDTSTKAVEEVAKDVPGLVWPGQVRMGHGQGLMVTEPPSICPEDETVLEPGMVISTEPGVQSGDVQFTWEDVHVITQDGSEQITAETTELREISWWPDRSLSSI